MNAGKAVPSLGGLMKTRMHLSLKSPAWLDRAIESARRPFERQVKVTLPLQESGSSMCATAAGRRVSNTHELLSPALLVGQM